MSDGIVIKVDSYDYVGDRVLDGAVSARLDSLIGDFRFKSIAVTSVSGDREAFRFAKLIKNYLSEKGHKVTGINQAIYSSPPIGVVINLPGEDRVLNLVVGAK